MLRDKVVEASGDSVAAEACVENIASPKQEKDGDRYVMLQGSSSFMFL